MWKFWLNPSLFLKGREGVNALRRWARKIYKKYNHTCQRCGYVADGKVRIEAHHIFPKGKYPQFAFMIWNGIVLCQKCHTIDADSYHAMFGNDGNFKMFRSWLMQTKPSYRYKIWIIRIVWFVFIVSLFILGNR